MRHAFVAGAVVALGLAACSSGGGAGAPAASSATGPTAGSDESATWYVAMGTSIAAGLQPGRGENPATSYSGLLYDALRRQDPGLRYEPLGCSGERLDTMLAGGPFCPYPQSQLERALSVLRAHPGRVRLVTIDIGANDLWPCAGAGTTPERSRCISRRIPELRTGIATVLRRIRAAAPDARVVGMTYYDPLLGGELVGGAAADAARSSVAQLQRANAALGQAYRDGGARVADVAGAFATGDTTPTQTDLGTLPRDVAQVCRLTYMCTDGDIHPDDEGQQVIADAFARALR